MHFNVQFNVHGKDYMFKIETLFVSHRITFRMSEVGSRVINVC